MAHKYIEIKNSLINEIHDGLFKPGDIFYSESEAINKFGVSSITVRRAFRELTQDGYLYSIKGKGRFISYGKHQQKVTFTDVEKNPKATIDVKVISIKEIQSERIRNILRIGNEKKIYKFERLRSSNDTPFFLQYSYISSNYINEEDIHDYSKFMSIYSKLKEDFNINLSIMPSTEYYRIIFPTPQKIANLLEIHENEPTSFAERTTYTSDGDVIEYIESYKRWDYYCSKIEAL